MWITSEKTEQTVEKISTREILRQNVWFANIYSLPLHQSNIG